MESGLATVLTRPESPERTAALAEWIQSLFEETPTLVGGAAVELYTRGAYTTRDLDFVGSVPSSVEKILEEEGFIRRGRHWVHEEGRVFVEFPGAALPEGAEAVDLELGSGKVRVIAPEALIADRLAAWQFWGSEEDAVNALLVARAVSIEEDVLDRMAESQQVRAALENLRTALDRWAEEEPAPEELQAWARQIPGG